jgi:hydrogenase maturation protein HypF
LGRVFDAAAALAGVCLRQAYEGEAAMRLEALVVSTPRVAPCWRLEDGRLDVTPLLAELLDVPPREAAEMFHAGLIDALAAWIGEAARREGVKRVALGGGCVMNRVLTDGLCAALRAQGLVVAIPRALPANDGGLSFGQAAFALAGLR